MRDGKKGLEKERVESDTFVLVSGVKVEKTAMIDLVWDRVCF